MNKQQKNDSGEPSEGPNRPTEARLSKSIRILHLENSSLDAELIRGRLEIEGLNCEIECVATETTFASALEDNSFQIILTDFNVPGYDGLAAVKLARERLPNTPIIVISGSLGEEAAVKCLKSGATDYLLKQRLDRLPSAIEHALEQAREQILRKQAEQKFQSLLEFAPDAIVIVDNLGKISLLNCQAEKLFGYQRTELLGQTLDILIPERFSVGHAGHVASFFESPSQRTVRVGYELFGRHKSGAEFPVDVSLSPLDTLEGTLTISAIRDMTERRKLEAQLVRAQRLESIGSFAGNIAHDLNNALAPVLMSLELIRLQNPASTELVATIESAARRGADMLRQLLVFSKGSYVDPKPVDLKELLDDIGRIITRTFPKSIELRTRYADGLQPVCGDSTQLHQILLNLCVNARDAMPGGGVLTITADNVKVDESYASIVPNAVPGNYVLWRISDTGSGIPSEVLDRIFEPFFTTKQHGRGTGLGLSIVVGIVKSHRGFVNVYSVPEKGSTFSVYLPVDNSGIDNPGLPQTVQVDLRGNGETILVVDDSEGIRSAATAVLSALDFQVVTAANGEDALRVVLGRGDDLAAVITDLHMPRMDGQYFVTELKKVLPNIGVIVTSGNLDEDAVNDFRALGVQAFLEKPFTQEKLTSALSSVFLK